MNKKTFARLQREITRRKKFGLDSVFCHVEEITTSQKDYNNFLDDLEKLGYKITWLLGDMFEIKI